MHRAYRGLLVALFSSGWLGQAVQASEPPAIKVSSEAVRQVDPRYLSVALDTSVLLGGAWWTPRQQLDLQQADLLTLTRALAPAYLRVGGTDADKVFYQVPGVFAESRPIEDSLLLTQEDWEQLTAFARQSDLPLIFTLNAGPGPRDAQQRWLPANAQALIGYATQRQDPVAVWELGNEINGFLPLHGYGLSARQYGQDLWRARQVLQETQSPARLAGPASAYWPLWGEPLPVLPEALKRGGQALDIVSWHYYPQQSSRCLLATRRAQRQTLLRPQALDEVQSMFGQLRRYQLQYAPTAEIWLGETGHAQCGGEPGLSDRFASSLWWLDQLGQGALLRGQQVQIRQSLLGSDYGLLDEVTFQPRPDYWASVLWKRLMGPEVLAVKQITPLRSYAHCHPTEAGWTALLINLNPDKSTSVNWPYPLDKSTLYQLSAAALESRDMQLNGQTLRFTGTLPELTGQPMHAATLHLPPASASFIHVNLPQWPGCLKP